MRNERQESRVGLCLRRSLWQMAHPLADTSQSLVQAIGLGRTHHALAALHCAFVRVWPEQRCTGSAAEKVGPEVSAVLLATASSMTNVRRYHGCCQSAPARTCENLHMHTHMHTCTQAAQHSATGGWAGGGGVSGSSVPGKGRGSLCLSPSSRSHQSW